MARSIEWVCTRVRRYGVGKTWLVLGGIALTLVPMPAHADSLCKPATPLSQSKCTKDSQCCPGLVCQAGRCQAGCRIGGTFVASGTLSGQCRSCQPPVSTTQWTPLADATSCNDGNACTLGDACSGGTCVGGNPVTCAAPDQCHVGGTCNPSTGVCGAPTAKPDGTSCNDGNACTQTDTCRSGVCTGANPVACAPSDQCHVTGTCNSTTGICSNPTAPNGTACNDGNACTRTDTCQAGVCTGTNPVVCVASDQCHVAGSCDPASGACSNPAAANGTRCNDGNACTQIDTCQTGVCTGMIPVVCVAPDQCHDAGTCDPSTGTCGAPPAKPDGTTCNDGNACTQVDACHSGVCGGSPVTCGEGQCVEAGTCDPQTGACVRAPKADGTACDDRNPCTLSDACANGVCVGSNPVVCSVADQCHNAATCDPATGACFSVAKPDGTSCSDGNDCTDGDACQAGECVSGTARPNGAACDDGIACTDASICTNGACGSGQPNCATSDLCIPVYCDFFTGSCQGAPVSCKNGDFNGSPPGYQNCWSSICNSATGKCEGQLNSLAPYCGDECGVDSDCGGIQIVCVDGHCGDDGSACSADADCGIAPNACVIASCSADQSGLKRCFYNDVNCDDGNACTSDGCDPVHGCAHHPLDPTVACDDNVACTEDVCDASTGCGHVAHDELCDDGDSCTTDTCGPSGCEHTGFCDDGDPTTTDACNIGANGAAFCTHTPIICTRASLACTCADGSPFVIDFANSLDGCPVTPQSCAAVRTTAEQVCVQATGGPGTCATMPCWECGNPFQACQ